MPYAQFDDRYDDHRKTKRAWRTQPAAVGLHAMAITYCNRHKTDGLLDADWVEEKLSLSPLSAKQQQAAIEVLLEHGLFEREGDNYKVHDFLEWNRSRAQREALAEQGRRGGQAKAAANAKPPDSDGSGPGSSQGFSDGYSNGHSDGSTEGSSTLTPRHATPSQASSSSDADRADVKVTDDDHRLCSLLRQRATERNPKFKVKSRSRWLTDMRLLRDNDGNQPAEIESVIEWVFRDDFWGGVIQSPGNLREHFPKIWDRMQHPNVVAISERRESPSDLIRAMQGDTA